MATRPQFSIRLLLMATAGIAAALGAVTAPPGWHTLPIILLAGIGYAAMSIIFAVMTKRRIRAFWIGFAVAAGLAAIVAAGVAVVRILEAVETNGWHDAGDSRLLQATRLAMAGLWCAGVVNGAFCAVVHRLVWPRPKEPVDDSAGRALE
jgi:hypothetical protein